MTLPLLFREMDPSEIPMVLSDWKNDLRDERPAWGRALQAEEWWALVNFVLDRITLPTSTVWTVCHRYEPSVPLCWAASREGEILHMHARVSVHAEPDLAARLDRDLREHTQGKRVAFNPFLELKRKFP